MVISSLKVKDDVISKRTLDVRRRRMDDVISKLTNLNSASEANKRGTWRTKIQRIVQNLGHYPHSHSGHYMSAAKLD